MSVAPDLLLQSSPELKPRKAQARQPEKPAEPATRKDSSFAEVYASERKAKTAEPEKSSARANKPATNDADDSVKAELGEASVAESGNTLPDEVSVEAGLTELPPDEVVLDPLLMLGMSMQTVDVDEVLVDATAALDESSAEEVTDELPEIDADPLNQVLQGLFPQSEITTKLNEVGADSAAVATQDMAVIAGASNLAAQQLKPGQASEREAGKALAGAAVAVDAQLPMAKTADSLASEPALAIARLTESDSFSLDAKAESATDLRTEGFAGKLSQLSQAITQQAVQASRLPLVPGQPLAMHQGGWSEAVVDRVMWLSSQNLKSAEIQLDPAELGRMEVRIEMGQDATKVTFVSPHAGVRDALESQSHRLRELFTQQGMSLDVNVSDQSLARGSQGQGDDGQRRGSSSGDRAGLVGEEVQQGVMDISRTAISGGRGLVDYYA